MRRVYLKETAGCLAVLFFIGNAIALADMPQMKIYKEAFPGEKPKCATCHLEALPKKENGKGALNAYGQKVVAIRQTPTAEDYKQAGKA